MDSKRYDCALERSLIIVTILYTTALTVSTSIQNALVEKSTCDSIELIPFGKCIIVFAVYFVMMCVAPNHERTPIYALKMTTTMTMMMIHVSRPSRSSEWERKTLAGYDDDDDSQRPLFAQNDDK